MDCTNLIGSIENVIPQEIIQTMNIIDTNTSIEFLTIKVNMNNDVKIRTFL